MAGASASTVRVTFLGDTQSLARATEKARGALQATSEKFKSASVAQLRGEVAQRNYNAAVARFGGDSTQALSALAALRSSTESLEQQTGKTSSKVTAFFGGFVGGAAVAALGKVKEFAAGSVDAFARIEDATGAAGVQFGEQLPAITAFADQAAKSFGISKGAALDAANTFGTLGKSAGLSGADLSTFATDLSGLAGDLASFKGTSTEQAIDAVGAALRGETEPIRAYGVMLDQAAIEAEALAMKLVKPVKNMEDISAAQTRAQLAQKAYNAAVKEHGTDSDQAARANLSLGTATRALDKAVGGQVPKLTAANKVLASQSLILKATTDAQGDFGRTSDSTANVQKTLAAETENAQAKLGEQLAPALTAVRTLMLQGIRVAGGMATQISALAKFVDKNRTAFIAIAAVVATVVLPAMIKMAAQWIATGIAATVSAVKQAAAWLMTQMSAYRAAAAMAVVFAGLIAQWIRTAVVATASAVRMAAAWIIAMGPIAIAIAAVVGITLLVIRNWDKIRAATVAAWNAVVGFVKQAVSLMVSALMNFTGPGLVIKHWDKIVAIVKGVPGKLKSAVGDFLKMGSDLIGGFIQGIKDRAGEILTTIKSYVTDKIPGWIKKPLGISSPSKLTREYGQNLTEGMIEGIKDRAKALAEQTQTMVDTIKDRLAEVKSFASDIRSSFAATADLTSFDTGTDAKSFTDQLAARAKQAQEFAKGLKALRKAGLNDTTLGQLRDAGPERGADAVKQLLTTGNVGQVNGLVKQINQAGRGLANSESRAEFGINDNRLTNREIRVILDLRGDDADTLKRIRKQIRAQGGNVQTVLGAG